MIAPNGRLAYACAAAAIVRAGVLCHGPALGLPWFVAKWGGSALWGAWSMPTFA